VEAKLTAPGYKVEIMVWRRGDARLSIGEPKDTRRIVAARRRGRCFPEPSNGLPIQ